MQPDHIPSPHRFQVFTQLPNGKGFKIKNSRYIYFFDKYGGWYDQYNNYYNCDGESEDPPHDEDEDFQRVLLEEEYGDVDEDDYFDREYGVKGGVHDHGDDPHHAHNPHQKTLQRIAHNATTLHEYPTKTPLRVDFSNIPFHTTKQQILKHYRSKLGNGLLNAILIQENNRFTGEGYFVCQDVSVAEKLIKYQGEEFLGRRVSFDVEPVEESLVDKVTKEEMGVAVDQDQFEPLVKGRLLEGQKENDEEEGKTQKKKYLTKTQTQAQTTQQKKEQPKPTIQQPPKPQEQNKEPKKEQPKPLTFTTYLVQVTPFPKKTSFKQWMSSLKFTENQHFINPSKAESKDPTKKFATVGLRSDVFEKVQGKEYAGKKVLFERVQ